MMTVPESAQVSLPGDTQVRVTRAFRAPRELVWEAYTSPELLRRWLTGYPGWPMTVCEMDVRAGGSFRWRWREDATGKEFGFHGEYLEVDAPGRLYNTEAFDPGDIGGSMGAAPALVTVTFEEHAGETVMTTLIEYDSRASRDEAVATGMTDGMEFGYRNLDGILAERRKS